MTDRPKMEAELQKLIDAACNDTATPEQIVQLEEMLRGNREACVMYLRAFHLQGELRFLIRTNRADSRGQSEYGDCAGVADETKADGSPSGEDDTRQDPPRISLDSPLVLDLAPVSPSGGRFVPYAVIFSYATALLVLAIGLLIGSRWYLPVKHDGVVNQAPPGATPSDVPPLRFVGRITEKADCRWADPSTDAADDVFVPLGRKYELASGLMEITYTGGAKVLLQGPCTYQVDSSDGGYLELGRLTAKVEKPANSPKRRAGDSQQMSPESALSHASSTVALPGLLAIRTPTALVIDLGTEFAVEVDQARISYAHVFRGRVEVRTLDATGSQPRSITLRDNESAKVQVGHDRMVSITREVLQPKQRESFVRQIPKWVRIPLFKTGEGLKEGGQDPHWQVVARSDDPNFKARAAVTIRSDSRHKILNYSEHSNWPVSLSTGPVPNGVRYTFRTTFDMTGLSLTSATIRGSVLVDDRVVAIRLNGRNLFDPPKVDAASADHLRFRIEGRELLAGINVFEIDVFNGGSADTNSATAGIVACAVPWEGWATKLPEPTTTPSSNPPASRP